MVQLHFYERNKSKADILSRRYIVMTRSCQWTSKLLENLNTVKSDLPDGALFDRWHQLSHTGTLNFYFFIGSDVAHTMPHRLFSHLNHIHSRCICVCVCVCVCVCGQGREKGNWMRRERKKERERGERERERAQTIYTEQKWVCIYVVVCMWLYVYECVWLHTCLYECVGVYVCVCAQLSYVDVCSAFVCVCVCVYEGGGGVGGRGC